MGELHNTHINSACNCIVHALNTLGALIYRMHTTLNRIVLCILYLIVLLVMFSGIASAGDQVVSNIYTRVVTDTSATIHWECPHTPVKSQIEWGLTTSYGHNTPENAFSYYRLTDITGLSADTTYHYRVKTTDLHGNVVYSDDRDFTTINAMEMENIVKAARGDGGLPKTYYVSTTGNNLNDGRSLGTAWKTPAYAASKADAGDIIWVLDGSYFGGVDFGHYSGNEGIPEYPITMKAYDGTPDIAGVIEIQSDYITFDGFVCHSATATAVIDVRYNTGIKILNCEVYDSGVDCIYLRDVTYSSLVNCTVHDSGWNGFGIKPTGVNPYTGHHIMLNNCTAYHNVDNDNHHGYDVQGSYIIFEDCKSQDSDGAPLRLSGEHVVIYNFTGIGGNNGFNGGTLKYSSLINSTFPDKCVTAGYLENVIIYNNYFNYAYYAIRVADGYNLIIEKNKAHSDEISGYTYIIHGTDAAILRDERILPYKVRSDDGADVTIEFTDGKVFTENKDGEPRYYPESSIFTFNVGTAQITSYPITLRPTHGHLHDVTVGAVDKASGTYHITVSSTESENPTWINLTTKTASATYNIARDGKSYTQATTGADGVLRYQYTGTWDRAHTFKFSYASGGMTPVPRVTGIRSDAPTQNAITLRWDCSVQDIDYYTIHKDGALLDTTLNKYYSATNLVPDTTYTFGVSATKDSTTGDSVDITVKTAEGFDISIASIAKDAAASPGGCVNVPIMIHDAEGVACYGVNLTYDAEVVTVTSVTQGDFTTYFGFDSESAADGWVTVNTYVSETSLNGDVKIADVTLKAVGAAGDTSPLDMEIVSLADQNGYPVSGIVSNGMFTVLSDMSPPAVTYPSASQLIPDDTDGVPSWGETATLNVTVTDGSGIAGVVIDLSAIGGSTVQPMTYIGNNIWSATTNASAGTPPKTYDLPVCATDIHGYVNMSESVELVVMRNGDVTGDDDVTPDDVALLANYVTYPGRYTISSEFVADVTDDGVVDIADAMMLANHVASPDRRTLRFVGSTC